LGCVRKWRAFGHVARAVEAFETENRVRLGYALRRFISSTKRYDTSRNRMRKVDGPTVPPGPFLRPGPGGVCWALCAGPYYSEHAENRQTGNGGALASGWLPCLLAVEITTARRPADYSIGNLPAHSRDQRREPASLIGRSGSSAFRLSTTSSVERIPRGWNKVHKRGCRHPQSRTSPALIPRLPDLSSVM
jgi:hypothetical protein